jgi:hypothetical protein
VFLDGFDKDVGGVSAVQHPARGALAVRGDISRKISNMHFLSSPDLKPTEIQPPTAKRRTPAVRARKPATRARLMRALRRGGTIALKVVLIMLGGACAAFVASLAAAH